ncbi:hypothetical protein BOX15_Mlig020185g1 [Macrostomum lignano]|uniref:Phosphatidic acid phosphatase type 2/haloperoxidase domain-containing protein n=1 Tax=Macrostomum lignano TaxID=282301 RepID=A0A267FKW4_9PLAT|nr:hypothetical protein BOX15_Mlig020185g1 [Macrostomum lignano]
MLESIKHLVEQLNNPKLVASFQDVCGIDIGYKDSGLNSMDEEEEDEDSNNNCDTDLTDSGAEDASITAAAVRRRAQSSTAGGKQQQQKNKIHSAVAEDVKSQSWTDSVKCRVQNTLMDYSMRNNVDYKIKNLFLYHLFTFGAMLGNEEFNCTFFPYWFWNVDGYVCRRVVIAWGFSMWFGQALKDLIRSPRPASPPVAKLERRYELEYGFPSTHATTAIVVPFSLFLLTRNRYLYSTELGFLLCSMWSVLVCLSRIYLGMHSVLDVTGGALFGVAFLAGISPLLDSMDNFQLTHPWAPVIIPLVLLLLCCSYPKLDQWNSARGDSSMTVAVMCGVSLASWLAYRQGFYNRPPAPPPYAVKFPDLEFLGSTAMRMALGGTVLIATRSAMKALTYRCLCLMYGLDPEEKAANLQLLQVELPYKFVTYSLVSFNVVYTCPILFRRIGIERIIAFTDLNPI